jgi:hypothetical protein
MGDTEQILMSIQLGGSLGLSIFLFFQAIYELSSNTLHRYAQFMIMIFSIAWIVVTAVNISYASKTLFKDGKGIKKIEVI